jgi:hypothetical protein
MKHDTTQINGLLLHEISYDKTGNQVDIQPYMQHTYKPKTFKANRAQV